MNQKLETMRKEKDQTKNVPTNKKDIMEDLKSQGSGKDILSMGKYSAVDLQAQEVIDSISYHGKIIKRLNFLFKENL